MRKQKSRERKPNFWSKLFRFFFPENFKGELKKGMEVGKGSHVTQELGRRLYGLGKVTRKKVDPEHKMKIGKQGRTK